MNKLSEKILARLKVVATVVAVAVVAVAASAVMAPQPAWAADVSDEWLSETDFSVDDSGVYHVKTAKGWYYFASASRDYDFDGATVVLDNDIDFAGINDSGSPNSWAAITGDADDANAFTVGDDDMPFSGTFNGQGYTISNFDNHRDGLALQVDCGFFGQTREATIKNTNFRDCYVGATYRGGLVAGYAQDTFFLNITCTNCTASIIPPNNVLNLITNAGMSGGMICGEANGSTLYNCEVAGGTVVNNATSGVGALGGQPLYLGGLVGWCNDTVIEYSRVTDIRDEDDKLTHTSVENKYGTAVSVASYSEVFTGGIVGGMKSEDSGSKIVDCYCTADVYSEAAIYFAVGLGLGVTRGYTGGIVGIVQDGGTAPNLIQRVSYAGNLHSYNYNILLLGIPIIEHDKYMGGITGRGGNNATIDQAYFMRNENGLGMGSSTGEDIYAVKTTYNGGYSDGAAYGPRDDSYVSRDFWEGCGFDFAGGTLRNAGYPFTPDASEGEWDEYHYNKWVMDYTRGIPVHGGSIKATMDFPGSGMVTIGQTGLAPEGSEQSTSDPYDFAVQGYEQGDESIELTYEFTTERNESWEADSRNQGFRFMGWYRSRDVRVNDIAEDHSLFTQPNSTLNTADEGLLSDGHRVAANTGEDGQPDELTVYKPKDEQNPETTEYSDNDLYVAYAQANVLLHDADGNVINRDGTNNDAGSLTDDWYDYGATLVLPTNVEAGAGSESATLIGWTTDPAYTGILSSTELNECKAAGVFYEAGSPYVVTAPANLYPVYSDYISNAIVQYEGYERVASGTTPNPSSRPGFGTANAELGADGAVHLSITPEENSTLLGDTPTTRFLGWYELIVDGSGEGVWVRVAKASDCSNTDPLNSTGKFYDYSLAGVDLTQQHTYMARFEYNVKYLPHADSADIFADEWVQYGTEFHNYTDLELNSKDEVTKFLTWNLGRNHGDGGSFTDAGTNPSWDANDAQVSPGADGTTWKVMYPMVVHAHWEGDRDPDGGNGELVAVSDFPGSGAVDVYRDGVRVGATITPSQGFTFHTWEWCHRPGIFGNNGGETIKNANAGSKYLTDGPYWAYARMTAGVEFQFIDGSAETIQRRYQEQVLYEGKRWNDFIYHYGGGDTGTDFTTEDASAMTQKAIEQGEQCGYLFLGWVDQSAVTAGELSQGEWDYIFAGGDRIENSGITAVAHPDRALPYLLDESDLCYRTMTLYPVYVPVVQLETTTNIAQSGVDAGAYNIPCDPGIAEASAGTGAGTVSIDYNKDGGELLADFPSSVSLSYNASGVSNIRITVDQNVPIRGGAGDTYRFVSLSVLDENDNEVDTLFPRDGFDGSFAYAVQAGSTYTFRANYSPVPVTVTYHLSEGGEGSTEQFVCEVGDLLPNATSTPSFEGYGDFFYGWTVGDANGSALTWSEDIALVQPGVDRVTGAMHLWPVYRNASITVNSNIDSEAGGGHRGQRVTTDGQGVEVWAERSVQANGQSYAFKGWSTTGASGEIVSTSLTFSLFGDSRFPDPSATYTAVYEQTYQVRYHDTDGTVIYTQNLSKGDTLVKQQVVSVPGADGTTTEETVWMPVDIEPFVLINERFAQRNQDESRTCQEYFITWSFPGTTKAEDEVDWDSEREDNFTRKPIEDLCSDYIAGPSSFIDLYPVTFWFSAKTESGADYTTSLDWTFEPGGEYDALSSVGVALTEPYVESSLAITVAEHTYKVEYELPDPSIDFTKVGFNSTALPDVPVTLYGTDGFDGSAVDTQMTLAVEDETMRVGKAVFTFDGLLEITKQSSDPDAAGRTFAIDVTSADDPGKSRTVLATVGDEPDANGVYSGRATIALPYGKYVVSEDAEWAWRYESDQENHEVTVGYAGLEEMPDGGTALAPTRVTVKNNFTGKWFDGEDYRHNVFDERGGE